MSETKLQKHVTKEKEASMEKSLEAWTDRAVFRRLYKNYKKDKNGFSNPLTFIFCNTLQAALYSDQRKLEWIPLGNDDREKAKNWNAIFEADKRNFGYKYLLRQSILGSLIYGRQLAFAYEFDAKAEVPKYEIINMFNTYEDWQANTVNGKGGGRPMRFMGYDSDMTFDDIKVLDGAMNLDKLKPGFRDTSNNSESSNKTQTDNELNRDQQNPETDGKTYDVYRHFTIAGGERILTSWVGDLQVQEKVLERQDRWQILDLPCNPDPYSWETDGIARLAESAHKQLANLLTYAVKNAKFNSLTTYVYDSSRFDQSFFQYDHFNHIGVPGGYAGGSLEPVKKQPIFSEIYSLLDIIERTAQQATGIPDVQQGVASGNATATEIANLIEKVNTRLALYSESVNWFIEDMMNEYMWHLVNAGADIKKQKSIVGANGDLIFQDVKISDITFKKNPSIRIESKAIKDGETQRTLQNRSNYITQLSNIYGPEIFDQQAVAQMLGEPQGLTNGEIEQLVPISSQRRIQRVENKDLEKNKKVKVETWHNHKEHRMEMEGMDLNITAVIEHYETHLEMEKRQAVKEEEEKKQQEQMNPQEQKIAPNQQFNNPAPDAILA